MKALILFRSVHEVMEAESVLRGLGVETEMIPAPRAISSDCGMCIELEAPELPRALDALAGGPVPRAAYEVREKRYVRVR